ncbi:MAG: hypothetical protein C4536_06800 [Actinobacteria bacterium]|nr:MAG: hypothetical protein C4536_06800 [Actinomycetota bacterium]
MEEIFYEDILETFLFCFIASLGIIQIMVARRGWHGLSIYGGRARSNVNNALGAALLIFAYAWYFSDPLHRNVRNIEAFMSLACLVLGIVAAVAVTALLAALAETLRRRFGRGRMANRRSHEHAMESLRLPGATVLISDFWGDRGENLVAIAEPGRGSQNLMHSIQAALPEDRGFLSLHPCQEAFGRPVWNPDLSELGIMGLLAQVERERGLDLGGETFLGLGWGGNTLDLLQADLESMYEPRDLIIMAPVVPDCEQGIAGDALLSNTPLDIGVNLAASKPWKDGDFGGILRVWLPVFAVCVIAATAVTMAFDVRWKLFSGPMVGLMLSIWITYFLARWRGIGGGESMEAGLVYRLCRPAPRATAPSTAVLTSGDAASLATLPVEARSAYEAARLEVWEDILRGKFLLDGGTAGRMAALIWEERSGNAYE